MQKAKPPPSEEYPPKEANKRRDDALRAALKMPVSPHPKSKPSPERKRGKAKK